MVPMVYKGNYHTDTNWIVNKINWIKSITIDSYGNRIPVVVGLQNYRSDANLELLSYSEILGDMNTAMVANDGAGYIISRYGPGSYKTYTVATPYKQVRYKGKYKVAYTVKVRAGRYKVGKRWRYTYKYATKYKWKRGLLTYWLYHYSTSGKWVLT